MRRFKNLTIGTVIIIASVAVFATFYLRSSLPTYDGTMYFSALNDTVEIIRDERAIPHISAKNTHDLYFALGLTHAQDRLWQLEKNRRIAKGRLAEAFGPAALKSDKFLRTIGVYEAAKSAFQSIAPKTREALQAYADGVNAMVASHHGALPPEFIILGLTFEPWSPIDSLSWLKMMALDLSKNWRREVNRLDFSTLFSQQQINEFFPSYRYEEDRSWPSLETLYHGLLNRDAPSGLSVNVGENNTAIGSNNWVVDGSRTESGKPLLANDPHLGYSSPAIWYMVHLTLNGKNMVGVTMPAFPGVILGRNDQAAWGFTNTAPDVQDLYMERVADNPEQYWTPNGPENFERREEVFNIKGESPITISVRSTRHGPVLSDVLPNLQKLLGDKLVLSLRWTALDNKDKGANAVINLINVHSFEDFVKNMSDWNGPEQNMIFANTEGDIGYFAPALVPIRSTKNLSYGRVPAPGWDADFDWQGYIPFDELPRIKNPANGYLATANAKIVDNDYPHYLTSHWAYPYRTERIIEMLEDTPKHSIESFMKMQADTYSKMAAEFLPLMLPAIASTHPEIHAALSSWNVRMEKESPLPLIYYSWHRMMAKHIYGDELGEQFARYWHLRAEFLFNVLNNKKGQSRWCDNRTTEPVERCTTVLSSAFAESMDDLKTKYGKNWQTWRWAKAHIARHQHTPFSKVSLLRDIFDVTVPVSGGPYTVQVNNISTASATPFVATHGASYRAIYDLANLENSRYIYAAGQSGNVFSPYYDHLIKDWSEARYFKVSTNLDKVRQNNIGVLTLIPNK